MSKDNSGEYTDGTHQSRSERCGLNGCDNPIRRSVKLGRKDIELQLCVDCAEERMKRSANYDYPIAADTE